MQPSCMRPQLQANQSSFIRPLSQITNNVHHLSDLLHKANINLQVFVCPRNEEVQSWHQRCELSHVKYYHFTLFQGAEELCGGMI